VPEAIHASEWSVSRGEEVGSISNYGAEKAGGDAMAYERVYTYLQGGEAFDKRENSLGSGQPVPEVVREVPGGVPQYPGHLTTPEGWKIWPSSSMQADKGGVL